MPTARNLQGDRLNIFVTADVGQGTRKSMVRVTDPRGSQWSVHRRHWYDLCTLGSIDVPGEMAAVVGVVLLAVGIWPLWFVAHWLGLPWRIVIKRDGTQVDEEAVRGWGNSRRRMQEIAEAAAAGTLLEEQTTP